MLGGIVRLIAKTHIGSTCCLGTNFVVLKYVIKSDLRTSLVRVGTIIVPIEKIFNYVANITSSSSYDILKWKS
jgi:hypothetical protein